VTGYFEIFGLPETLSIDPEALQEKFYQLSRENHPDRFSRASAEEQTRALDFSSQLNDGYRVLREPLGRAEYVLKRNGFDIGEQGSKDVPPELLEEVFELNMALDELRSGGDDAAESLRESRERFAGTLAAIDSTLEGEFRLHDVASPGTPRREVLARIRGILNRRRYIGNLIREVDKELAPA
jgi:molecular chaperone HscB